MNYLLAILLFIAVDSVWLYMGYSLSSRMIQNIQGSPISIRILPALLVYVALAYLVSIPKNSKDAFLLGLTVYGVYDLTNYATLKNYTVQFAIMDTIWGGILMSSVWNLLKFF